MKKTDRLLAYIILLQTRRRLTAQQLAEHFEVSKRTVYRDILALLEAGVPIVPLPGKGYEILNSYFLPPVRLTLDEAAGLYIGSQLALNQTDASLRPHLQSAMTKIEAVLPPETQAKFDHLKRVIHLHKHPRHNNEKTKFMAPISQAILNRQILRIRYRAFSTEEETVRNVEPLWLLHYSNNWHLIGYCRLRQGLRDFRVNRIQQLNGLPETGQSWTRFSLSHYLEELDRFRQITEVCVKFSKQAVKLMRERGHWRSGEEKDLGDFVMATLVVENPSLVTRWLLSFGPDAEIIWPVKYRDEMRTLAQKMLQTYQSQPPSPRLENRQLTAEQVYSSA